MAIHTAVILIKASPIKVFNALTKPGLVKLWQFGKVVTSDWVVGHAIKFSVEFEEKVLEQQGVILEIRTNELIKYTLFTPKPGLEDKPENYNTTTYKLNNENGFTRVELIQEDNRSTTFAPISLAPVLAGLKKVVESLED